MNISYTFYCVGSTWRGLNELTILPEEQQIGFLEDYAMRLGILVLSAVGCRGSESEFSVAEAR